MRGWSKASSTHETLPQDLEGRGRRGARVEEEEYDGGDFEDENGYDSVVRNMKYGERHREDRNREDNNLGNVKMKIPSFQGKNDLEAYLE